MPGGKIKKWFVNVDRQLNKYAAKHGYIAVDFRGMFLRKAGKGIFTGESLIVAGSLRYVYINRQRMITWLDDLDQKSNRVVG